MVLTHSLYMHHLKLKSKAREYSCKRNVQYAIARHTHNCAQHQLLFWVVYIYNFERKKASKQASKKEEWARKQQQKMKQQLKVEID